MCLRERERERESMEKYYDVVIVGGGIAGLATALGLKRVGIRAMVLERSHELRATGAALSLFPNAWRALDALGVAHKLIPLYSAFTQGYVTDLGSGKVVQFAFSGPQDGEGMGVRPVHRKALLEALAQELPPETILFSSKLASITTKVHQDSSLAVLHMEDGTILNAKVLIGCDGVHSVVAQWLGLKAPIHSGRMAVRGLAVYPQGHGFEHRVQQFVHDALRAGFIPLNSTDVYWFIIYKSCVKGDEAPKDPVLIQKDVLENMAKDFPSTYLDVVQHTDLSTLTLTPLMFRFPLDLIFGPTCKGNVTVAGDAMHPMTPDLGQGGCAALEDAVILSRHIGNSFIKDGGIRSKGIKEALEGYVYERRWRAAGLITGSYLSGWVQQGGSSWLAKFIRDKIFYGLLYKRFFEAVDFDCGKLPAGSTVAEEN
ncbi:FAD-dependent urate hydroxylase [Cinnamomum micranthum f. kanehirae]|uniref:FAD-dependent urate hydroxylase n=1 Tax=Cinnamomum micranthum f. kanehirae TaxID=337451 RepID=A0A3S3MFA9_9MAGN|nr:FAD-dependent urate hydroxylase [Cinnamomum micranthum f. kanehirae]